MIFFYWAVRGGVDTCDLGCYPRKSLAWVSSLYCTLHVTRALFVPVMNDIQCVDLLTRTITVLCSYYLYIVFHIIMHTLYGTWYGTVYGAVPLQCRYSMELDSYCKVTGICISDVIANPAKPAKPYHCFKNL